METQVSFWEDHNVLFLDLDTGYRTVFTCENASRYILMISILLCMNGTLP